MEAEEEGLLLSLWTVEVGVGVEPCCGEVGVEEEGRHEREVEEELQGGDKRGDK